MIKKINGHTLLEMIIAVAILSLVAAAVAFVFTRALIIYHQSDQKRETLQSAQLVKEWLTRDLSATSCITQANTDSLELVSDEGEIRYFLENAQSPFNLMRSLNAVNSLFSENIDSLNFTYFDAAHQQTSTDIKTVEMTIVTRSDEESFELYSVSPVRSMDYCTGGDAYGGSGSDYLEDAAQTSDGGYVLLGYTNSFGGAGSDEILLTKLSSTGVVEWAKIYGGTGSDKGKRVLVLDNGYLIAGETTTGLGANIGTILIRTDENGAIDWYAIYKNSSNHQHSVTGLQETGNGFIVAGHDFKSATSTYQVFTLKVDKDDGGAIYDKTYGVGAAAGDYCMQDLEEAADGGYLIVGTTDCGGFSGNDILFLELNPATGAVVTAKVYDSGFLDSGRSVFEDPAGGYLFSGTNPNFIVFKTDNAGVPAWVNAYGTGQAYDFQPVTGGYLILGSVSGVADALLMKTDSSGGDIWMKHYGGISCDDAGKKFFTLQDVTNYIVTVGDTACYGGGGRNFMLFKTDLNGVIDNCPDFVRNAGVSPTHPSVSIVATAITAIEYDILPQSATIAEGDVTTLARTAICQ